MSATVIERLSSPALPKQLNFFVPRPINNTVSRGAPFALGRSGHEFTGGPNMWKLLTNLRQDEKFPHIRTSSEFVATPTKCKWSATAYCVVYRPWDEEV